MSIVSDTAAHARDHDARQCPRSVSTCPSPSRSGRARGSSCRRGARRVRVSSRCRRHRPDSAGGDDVRREVRQAAMAAPLAGSYVERSARGLRSDRDSRLRAGCGTADGEDRRRVERLDRRARRGVDRHQAVAGRRAEARRVRRDRRDRYVGVRREGPGSERHRGIARAHRSAGDGADEDGTRGLGDSVAPRQRPEATGRSWCSLRSGVVVSAPVGVGVVSAAAAEIDVALVPPPSTRPADRLLRPSHPRRRQPVPVVADAAAVSPPPA